MADTATATPAAPPAPELPKRQAAPKKAPAVKKAPAAKKAPTIRMIKAVLVAKKSGTSTHPKISLMVDDAIQGLNERGGSSFKAIKKYIVTKYKVDVEKLAPFMRRYLKSGVKNGALVQAKGKGANGSFKLPIKGAPVKKTTTTVKKVVAKKVAVSPKVKTPPGPNKTKTVRAVATTGNTTPAKKVPTKVKKSAATPKKAPPAPKKTSIKKATKVKVTKSPKPKKVVAMPKKSTPKRAAPKRK